jgi:AcrR family transcriptional regulator
MAKRGDELSEHILWVAKDVFLEMGFERASMDALAARAKTSKRTLYAHFESKDKLFLAVVDLVGNLYLDRLGTPKDYAEDPEEAAVLFCGRFLQMLLWQPSLRACRLFIAEAERIPEAAANFYDAIFNTAHDRLATFLNDACRLPPPTSTSIAQDLFGQTLYPELVRALLGVKELRNEPPDQAAIATDVDLAPIRTAVAALLSTESAAT